MWHFCDLIFLWFQHWCFFCFCVIDFQYPIYKCFLWSATLISSSTPYTCVFTDLLLWSVPVPHIQVFSLICYFDQFQYPIYKCFHWSATLITLPSMAWILGVIFDWCAVTSINLCDSFLILCVHRWRCFVWIRNGTRHLSYLVQT